MGKNEKIGFEIGFVLACCGEGGKKAEWEGAEVAHAWEDSTGVKRTAELWPCKWLILLDIKVERRW